MKTDDRKKQNKKKNGQNRQPVQVLENRRTAVLIRHLILAWLTAATIELLLVPAQLRSLTALDGVAAMSLARLLIVTGIVLALLEGTSRLLPTQAERWMVTGIFTVLAIAALCASFTCAFLAVCMLVFTILLVYSCYGWNRMPPAAANPHRRSASGQRRLWG